VKRGQGIVVTNGLFDRFIDLMRKITQSKGWAEYAGKNMMTVKFLGGADYAKYLAEERAKLTAVLQSMGKL